MAAEALPPEEPIRRHCRHCYGDCTGDCVLPGQDGYCIHRMPGLSFRQRILLMVTRLSRSRRNYAPR